MKRIRRRMWLLWLSVAYLLFLANWIFPTVRTSYAVINHTVMLVVFFLPILICIIGSLTFKGIGRFVFCFLVAIFAVCSGLLGIFSLVFSYPDVVRHGFDPAFEPVQSYQIFNSEVTVYRTNMGATTSFGIVVRHERSLFPGLLLVKRVYGVSPGYEANVTDMGNGTLRVISPPYNNKRLHSDRAIIHLKPWVYF